MSCHRNEPEGPPPTIGDFRAMGIRGFSVTCAGLLCRHVGEVTFDTLGLPDAVVFLQIPRHGRLLCSRCGGREVQVFPDWRDVGAEGNAKKPRL